MDEQYYVGRDDAQFGPFSALQMRELASKGKIRPTDSIWKEGTERKVLASQIKNLFRAPAAADSPPASAPAEAAGAPADDAETDESSNSVLASSGERASPAVETTPAPESRPAAPAPKPRPKRVVSIRGGVLAGQDGEKVQFRKQCEKCGHIEAARTTTAIRVGTFRVPFFCPKCRRGRTVELTGIN